MFIVAIPSYSRHQRIVQSTLALCSSWGIPHKTIFVFVVSEQFQTYRETLNVNNYHDVNIVCGPIGLHNMRNFITQYFENDTPILQMDDDIDDIFIMNEVPEYDVKCAKRYQLLSLSHTNAIRTINDAFIYTKSIHASLFGIYPVRNGYFMKDLPEVTTDLRFCVGAFWGIWNRKDLNITIEEKEDFERTLIMFEKDGKVVRYNRLCPKTKYYKTCGGMQDRDLDRKTQSQISCQYLCARWPQMCRLYKSKKNGMCEVRLLATNFIKHTLR